MSTALIKQLTERREDVWNSSDAVLKRAIAESRELTPAEDARCNKNSDDLDALDQRIASLKGAEQSAIDSAAAMAKLGIGVGRTERSAEDRDLESRFRHSILNKDRAPIDVSGSPSELRSGYQPGVERRDLVTTSGTPAGLLASSFHSTLVRHMVENSAILSAGATVLQTTTGEALKVPKSTALSAAGIVAEGATIPESDPTLGTVTLASYKYGFITQVSYELAEDNNFDLLGYLAEQAGLAIGNGFGAHAITGTGSSQPAGIVTGSTLGVTGATSVAGAFTADNLIDLYHSVAEPYARSRSAAWLMRNATLAAVRKLKDSQNRYLFDNVAPLGSGASGTLLGRPVYVDPTVAAVGLAAKSIVFGDISKYWVRQVNGVRFERSDDFAWNTDLATFRCLARLDGALIDTTGAVKHFIGGAS